MSVVTSKHTCLQKLKGVDYLLRHTHPRSISQTRASAEQRPSMHVGAAGIKHPLGCTRRMTETGRGGHVGKT